MKINYDQVNTQAAPTPKTKQDPKLDMNDITQMLLNFKEEYRNVFIAQVGGQIFFYRTLGRNEYKELCNDDRFNDFEKEELLCATCTLWPENFDFENCDAGIPTTLRQQILKNSYLDSVDSRKLVLEHYRQEMYDLDNQITCIINEAFPMFDIEEIEKWDVEKTTKYLSRAEWKLHNFRGLQFIEPEGEYVDGSPQNEQQPERQVQTQELKAEPKNNNNFKGQQKEKLTPEKLAELQRKFPEIDWTADSVAREGISAMKDSVDVKSPALRTRY